jgi:hypothetical protein
MNNKSLSTRPRRIPPNDMKPQGILKQDLNNNGPATNVPEKSPKISIGDAIGLITIRLCKIEERILAETKSDGSDTTHVLKTIFDRLTEVESKQQTMMDTINVISSTSSSSNMDNLAINTNDVEIEKLKIEVDDIKKLLIKLQEKLLDIITTK